MTERSVGQWGARFEPEFDEKAVRWLEEHPRQAALVIAYTSTPCCRGPSVCDVRLRHGRRTDRPSRLLRIGAVAGREVLMDARIVGRMPPRIPVTVRGFWRFKRLSLDLAGEEWARLLYSEPG